jgi:hypothetical protein
VTVGCGRRVVVAVLKEVVRTDGANKRKITRVRNRLAIAWVFD